MFKQVEKERIKSEEDALRLSEKKGMLNKSLRDTEIELDDCKKMVDVSLLPCPQVHLSWVKNACLLRLNE